MNIDRLCLENLCVRDLANCSHSARVQFLLPGLRWPRHVLRLAVLLLFTNLDSIESDDTTSRDMSKARNPKL